MVSKINPWKIQGYKPGQIVQCKIQKAEPGGYAVVLVKDNIPGYLPSNARHNFGDEVLATFVCIDKSRVLLSERFTAGSSAKGGAPVKKSYGPDWTQHLDELDSNYTTGAQQAAPDNSNQYLTGPLPAQAPVDPYSNEGYQQQQFATGPLPQQFNPPQQQYATGPLPSQQTPEQYMGGDQGNQYLTGAQPAQRYADGVPSRRFQLRRAIDLIMPPIDGETISTMRIGDYDVEWLITQLEGGMFTGCVKAACESRLSRAAMLLYKGRAVGCIYGCKADPTTKPTEESLQAMLSDLESPDTVVSQYDLPEEITLAMSSLFLGYPVERHDDYSTKEYLDYICNWLGQKNGTATLAISLTQDRGTCLGYIYKGQFSGAFYVEDQAYRADRAFVDEMLENDPQAALEVSILPPEMHASAVRFGFSLSMARNRNNPT
ncbi:hypothetical protein KF913_20510 [Candidatus Obscuribacterales bacterium]|nr:hypothetical protein [Candidatus Obscuribacterales bacterium]